MLLHAVEKPDQEIRYDGADRIPRDVTAEIARPGILLGTHAAGVGIVEEALLKEPVNRQAALAELAAAVHDPPQIDLADTGIECTKVVDQDTARRDKEPLAEQPPLQTGVEQLLLAGEIEIKRAFGDPQLGCHHVHGEAPESDLPEQFQRTTDDALLHGLGDSTVRAPSDGPTAATICPSSRRRSPLTATLSPAASPDLTVIRSSGSSSPG